MRGRTADPPKQNDLYATAGCTTMKTGQLPPLAGEIPAKSLPEAVVGAGRQVPLVRMAELEIDPAQLNRYEAAVKEEMETSVRVEPGVLAIYAVAEKSHPSKLRFFEVYANEAAYQSHIASAHFKKYVETTQNMITARKLVETTPILLSAKTPLCGAAEA